MPAHPSPRVRWALLPSILALLVVPECGDDRLVNGRGSRPAVFALRVGEHTFLRPQRAEIGFQRMTGDSRCPTNVVCVWEGAAGVRLWLLQAGRDTAFIALALPGSRSSEPAPLGPLGYQITALRLDPYPADPGAIPESDYVVTLEVERLRR